jgi:hypothetical protein
MNLEKENNKHSVTGKETYKEDRMVYLWNLSHEKDIPEYNDWIKWDGFRRKDEVEHGR